MEVFKIQIMEEHKLVSMFVKTCQIAQSNGAFYLKPTLMPLVYKKQWIHSKLFIDKIQIETSYLVHITNK